MAFTLLRQEREERFPLSEKRRVLTVSQPATIYQKSPDIVSRKIVDGMILVPIRRRVGEVESLYTLNEVGARIWELIDGRRRVSRDLPVAKSTP